ncbi:hypothetical protein WJX81_008423 [Elliptochloris bilobata]|uniref:J domain-containing protein n=1 Tax=Elliptochloris bilobata TaxID=381761 RepID=A0AAW1SBR3_9CHLO
MGPPNRANGHQPAPADLRIKAAEVALLRRTIAQRQRQLASEREAAARQAAAEAAAEQQRQQDLARRRDRLKAGFAQAFREAEALAAAELREERGAVSAGADAREVARVLAAPGDYEVLRLAPGASAAALRRRYREMAVALHPDKCKVDGATNAFQRMVQAYQNLLRFV